ncbi:niemann-Pick C1 protein [Trichinella spiralis]|uniref:niemann-Pick C1 protein n=1 Tax=Trichinella spiralis TaxID=6334 RepID=UPI0001EFD8B1|nr:niemann-Pick C1 protein [Trichinella spiralis]
MVDWKFAAAFVSSLLTTCRMVFSTLSFASIIRPACCGSRCVSVAVIDKIELGLDEKLSMPEVKEAFDSYMLSYFKSMNQYLAVGPPVYFVLKGDFNYADVGMQNQICGRAGCNENSLYGQRFRQGRNPTDHT